MRHNSTKSHMQFFFHHSPLSFPLPYSILNFPHSVSGYRSNIYSVFLFSSFFPVTSSLLSLAISIFPTFSHVQTISTFSHLPMCNICPYINLISYLNVCSAFKSQCSCRSPLFIHCLQFLCICFIGYPSFSFIQ